jgi:phenylacetate-CoA ligase
MTEAVRRGGRRPGHRPQAWVLSAEILTPRLREEAGETLGGELFDLYSSVEATNIARDCGRHRGLHIQRDEVVLEVLDGERPAPPGVEGDVVVTDLWNRATPIIRYAGLRDRAALVPEPCPCGNPSPRLVRIAGRRPGSLRLADGRTVHPYGLTLALEAVKGVAAYQIIQTSRDEVRALIVPGRPASDEHRQPSLQKEAADALGAVLGPSVRVTVEAVAAIPGAGDPDFTVVRSLDEGQTPES